MAMASCAGSQEISNDECSTQTNNASDKISGSREEDSRKSPQTSNRKRVYSFDDFGEGTPVSKLKLRTFISSSSRMTIFHEENNDGIKGTDILEESCGAVNKENIVCSRSSSQSVPSVTAVCSSDDGETENKMKKADPGADSRPNERKSHEAQQNDTGDSAQSTEDKSQHCSQLVLDDSHRVLYIHSSQLIQHCNQLPRISDRAEMVHSLIEALGLLQFLSVASPTQVAEEEVAKFHSRDYIDFLQRINQYEDEEKVDPEDAEQYGLTYDCPVQKGVYDCARLVAGATMAAAEALCEEKCCIAINWCGGWHHAQRSEASGFCYINDIVLGILKLRQKFSRVLYVDLDLHHGDGVENAFSTTPHVMTVSFHKFDSGFFPGSGSISDVGSRGGKFYSINVPFKDGICDADFFSVFKRVMTEVHKTYDPEVVVCQCGADGLAGDPMSSFNLTLTAYRHCLYFLMLWKLPLLLLGGGGYHHANTARCWASLTALTVGRKLPQDVPDHRHFPDYGPDYELTVEAGNRKNCNNTHDLINICKIITKNLQNIKNTQL